MTKRTYWELLKDPRWQRKRLEVMERAKFRCEQCDDGETTLNVHHKLYRKGAMPWEYAEHELQCVCENCHAAEHEVRDRLKDVMALMDHVDLSRLLGYAEGKLLFAGELEPVRIRDFEHLSGLNDAVNPLHTEYDLINRCRADKTLGGLEISEHFSYLKTKVVQ